MSIFNKFDSSFADEYLKGEHPSRLTEEEALRLGNSKEDIYEREPDSKVDRLAERSRQRTLKEGDAVQLRPRTTPYLKNPDLRGNTFVIKKIWSDNRGEIFFLEDSNNSQVTLLARFASLKKLKGK